MTVEQILTHAKRTFNLKPSTPDSIVYESIKRRQNLVNVPIGDELELRRQYLIFENISQDELS